MDSTTKKSNNAPGLSLNAPSVCHPWWFWGFVKLYSNQDSFFRRQKLQFIQTKGGKKVYEISDF